MKDLKMQNIDMNKDRNLPSINNRESAKNNPSNSLKDKGNLNKTSSSEIRILSLNSLTLDHLNMNVINLTESIQWYNDLFDFKVVETGTYKRKPWAIIKKDSTMLCLYEIKEKSNKIDLDEDSEVQINHFAFAIKGDVNQKKWVKNISQRQEPTFFDSPVKWPHSQSWYLKDPSGYTIEVALWNHDTPEF